MCHAHDIEALREYLREARTEEDDRLETEETDAEVEPDRDRVPAPADD